MVSMHVKISIIKLINFIFFSLYNKLGPPICLTFQLTGKKLQLLLKLVEAIIQSPKRMKGGGTRKG